ncbi:uncharacterized protein LOC111692472 [Anoplophora glabripennis]|uniref:uncharacterized protein LOC111692472 n=1 Tax=Anoplophora glabripennis TaxID=217634 RepID=UPI000C7566B1|nr:uncharacterized protein LOC111692472 [Anoplophora glabripennis]
MGDVEETSCRLCLKSITDKSFEVVDNVIRVILDILLLKLKFDNESKEVICNVCRKKLNAASEFKSTCLNTDKAIIPYVDSKKMLQLDLREVYMHEKKNELVEISCSQKVCRLCMHPVESEFRCIREVELEAIEKLAPEMNMNIIKDPVVCKPCFDSLCTHNSFLKDCLEVEEKINSIFDSSATENQVDTSSLDLLVKTENLEEEFDINEMEMPIKIEGIDIKLEDEERRAMGDVEEISCRLCLTSITDKSFEVVDNVIRVILDILLLKLKFDNESKEVICNVCRRKLVAASEFKSTCLNTDKAIIPYVDSEKMLQLDLREVYMHEKKNELVEISCSRKVCRLCMEPVESEFRCIREVELEAIEKLAPEMNMNIIKDPVVCKPCFDSLCTHNSFLKDCLEVEEKINSIFDSSATENQVDTSSLDLLVKTENLEEEFDINEMEMPIKIEGIDIKLEDEERSDTQLQSSDIVTFEHSVCKNEEEEGCKHENGAEITTKQECKVLYKCDKCIYETESEICFTAHSARHDNDLELYKCESCEYKAENEKLLQRHLLNHEGPSQMRYHCHQCQLPMQSLSFKIIRGLVVTTDSFVLCIFVSAFCLYLKEDCCRVMTDVKEMSCRLCLKNITDESFEVINDIIRDILDGLLLKLKFDDESKEVICNACRRKLNAASEFKSTCLNTDNIIIPYVDSEKMLQLDLREVYMQEKKSNST